MSYVIQQSDNGNYILLAVDTGAIVVWDVIVGKWTNYFDAGECFKDFRKELEELKIFPNDLGGIGHMDQDSEGLKDKIREFGWPPPAQGDGNGWKREECLKEAERLWNED